MEETIGILLWLSVKAGKEEDAESFLRTVALTAEEEHAMMAYYLLRLGTARLGIFCTFKDEEARMELMCGRVVTSIMAKSELFDPLPRREDAEILRAKERDLALRS